MSVKPIFSLLILTAAIPGRSSQTGCNSGDRMVKGIPTQPEFLSNGATPKT